MLNGLPDSRPDLILIMTDQQRHDQVGYASGGHFETPALDDLARRGVIFDTAYSAATTCVPARASLLTGMHPHRLPTQENGAALAEGFWTVARALQGAGYETALIGKMHFSPVHARHGFDTMRLCEHLAWQGLGPLSRARGDEVDDYHNWLLDHEFADWRVPGNGPMPAEYPADVHPTAWVAREATTFITTRDPSRPLFLIVSFPHPHAPYDPPPPYASMYDPVDSVLPPGGYELNEQLPMVFQLATLNSKTRAEAADPRRVRTFLATVRGLIRQIDDAVGTLLAHLPLDRAVLFFTSDHGDYAAHRGLMRKNPWITFDDLTRVPLCVAGPGVTGGRRLPHLVQSCDVALTCLDYAGVRSPEALHFDTRSLRPMLEDNPTVDDLDRAVVSGTHHMGWPMIRRGPYKYIEHQEHDQCVLFDLYADPLERFNRAGDPALRPTADELAHELRSIRSQRVLEVAQPG